MIEGKLESHVGLECLSQIDGGLESRYGLGNTPGPLRLNCECGIKIEGKLESHAGFGMFL